MSQALQVSNAAADLAAAAERINSLIARTATTAIELGAELKRVRDAHFPLVIEKGKKRGKNRERAGWEEWLKANCKLSKDRAGHIIKVAEKYANKPLGSPTRGLPVAVLEQLFRRADDIEIEADLNDANKESLRKTGKPISKKKAEYIIKNRLRIKRNTGMPENTPQLPSKSEAQRIAQSEREKGNIVLIPARDGQFYTGAHEDEVKAHEAARDLALMVEYAIDTLLKVEATPHEYMTQTPPWLRWWLTKDGNISTKGRKVGEVARWLTAFAAAVEHGR